MDYSKLSPEECAQIAAAINAKLVGKSSREIRAFRKANGLCVHCGRPNDSESLFTCSLCRLRQSEYEKTRRKRNKPVPRHKPDSGYTLSQIVRMAAERHVSYGQMVVLIEKGVSK